DLDDIPEGSDWLANINPKSLERLTGCRVEPLLAKAKGGERYQFERLGYFSVDSADSSPGSLVFNRTVTLRDTWAKIERTSEKKQTPHGAMYNHGLEALTCQ